MHFDPLCLFLCFKVRCLWSPCFGPWSTSFLRRFLWSFLFLSLAKIKQCLPPAFNKNSCHHRDFLRYSWEVLGHSQFCFCGPSWANALHCDLHPPPLKWLTEQKNPFEVCKHAARYNEFGCKLLFCLFKPIVFPVSFVAIIFGGVSSSWVHDTCGLVFSPDPQTPTCLNSNSIRNVYRPTGLSIIGTVHVKMQVSPSLNNVICIQHTNK